MHGETKGDGVKLMRVSQSSIAYGMYIDRAGARKHPG